MGSLFNTGDKEVPILCIDDFSIRDRNGLGLNI